MPRHVMLHTVTLLTSFASESWNPGRMYLSRLATFGYAPSIVGDVVVLGFDCEFGVATTKISSPCTCGFAAGRDGIWTYR
jgi:hypothetical protein